MACRMRGELGEECSCCSFHSGLSDTAVPESPEWKEQQEHSSPNSPRMRQAMTHAPRSPGVYVRVNP